MSEQKFWWQTDDPTKYHEKLFRHVRNVEDAQSEIHKFNVFHARLYNGRDLIGTGWVQRNPRNDLISRRANNTENVIQNAIDTMTGQVARTESRPVFMTDEGDFSHKRRARHLQWFMAGEFQRSKFHLNKVALVRDALVFGTGVLKPFIDPYENKVKLDKPCIDEIVVDEEEAINGRPHQVHHRKLVNRFALLETWMNHPSIDKEDKARIEKAIKESGKDGGRYARYRHTRADQVVVIETHKLPSYPGAGDGVHTIVTEKGTLWHRKWEFDWFPYCFYRWSPPLAGFYGIGGVEMTCGMQLRLNRTDKKIELSHDLLAVPRVFTNDKRIAAKFTDKIGQVIYAPKGEPTFFTPQAMPAEVYRYRARQRERIFDRLGISLSVATSKKPVGLDSAPAQREHQDIISQRHVIEQQRLDDVPSDLAMKWIEFAKMVHGRKKYVSVFRGEHSTRRINWADVNMDRDSYVIKVETASILSSTPAGRVQTVTELSQAGLLSQDEARDLLNHPDLKSIDSQKNAARRREEQLIEKALDGELVTPTPFTALDIAFRMWHDAVLKAELDGAPEEILEPMRRYIEQVDFLRSKMAEAAAAPPQVIPDDGGLAPPSDPGLQPAAPAAEPPPLEATG